ALGTTAYAVFRMDDVSLYASTYRDLFWIVLILLVGFSVLFIHSSRKWIHTPLRQLIEGFGQIHQGNLEYRIDTRQPNEFGYLMDEFNHMAAGLADSISRYTKQQLALKKAELQQLQLQVKPHFLYNCFYNINSLCTARDYARIKDLTRHLASFYAYATHGDVFEATLMQEYGYAADYLAIQHIRFGDRVHVAVESLPACVEALPVPMFILQPIIENAFKHGCEAHEGEAHICWRTQVVGRMLRIQVENSGDGNVTPILAHIEALLASSETERISGLVNVSRRLRLFFEDRADLRFTEGALGGLCVTLTLRLEKETTA
ncbi:MAG: histidine kinase, partial [Clostridia bacterium]